MHQSWRNQTAMFLGGLMTDVNHVKSTTDLNSLKTSSIWACGNLSDQPQKWPASGVAGMLVVFGANSANVMQVVFPRGEVSDNTIYFRSYYNGTWYGWKKITGTAV